MFIEGYKFKLCIINTLFPIAIVKCSNIKRYSSKNSNFSIEIYSFSNHINIVYTFKMFFYLTNTL